MGMERLPGADHSEHNVTVSHDYQEIAPARDEETPTSWCAMSPAASSNVHSGGTVTGAFRRHSLTNMANSSFQP